MKRSLLVVFAAAALLSWCSGWMAISQQGTRPVAQIPSSALKLDGTESACDHPPLRAGRALPVTTGCGPTWTPTATPTATATRTPTVTPTATVTMTPTASPSVLLDAFSFAELQLEFIGTLTVNHALGSGPNRLVVVAFYGLNGSVATSATFNGVAMTALAATSSDSNTNTIRLYQIGEADLPAAGTYEIAVTHSAPNSGIGAVSFSNVNQTTKCAAYATVADMGPPSTLDVTSHTGDIPVVFGNLSGLTFGTITTSNTSIYLNNGARGVTGAVRDAGAAPTVTLGWDGNTANDVIAGCSVTHQ